MKPSQLQQQILQQYLGSNLKYRETYAEFYDHILAALEDKPQDGTFEDAARNIINNDFGGMQGMRFIEDKYQYSIFTEMRRKYLNYIIQGLKFPWVGVIGVLAMLVYMMVKQPWFNFGEFLLLMLFIRIIPALLQMAVRFNADHVYGEPRRSIKWGFFRWLNRIPAIVVCAWLLLTPGSFNNSMWLQNINPFVMTALLMLMAIHSFTFYKVYSGDIKTSFKLS